MSKKRLGILAGMGPRSTGPFLESVYDECQRQYHAVNDIDYPEIVIYSWPTPFYINRPVDDAALSAAIKRGLIELSKADVSVIAMPCNTAHKYFKELERCIGVKLLNIIDIAAGRLDEFSNKVTIFGTESTMNMGIYQDAVRKRDKEVYFEKEWQEEINKLIISIKNKDDYSKIAADYQKLENRAVNAGVDTIIFACTDLSVISNEDRKTAVIDSSKELAVELIKEYSA
jgi:aspartate racemase